MVLWRLHAGDWNRRATEKTILNRIESCVRGGDILLLHDRKHGKIRWDRRLEDLCDILEKKRLTPAPFQTLLEGPQ
jgi:hypothetical protein